MLEERDDSDGSLGSPKNWTIKSKITWKTSLKALFYKSVKVQQRNYCANICQIITPLLCVAFTLVIQTISEDIITSTISVPSIPRPLDLPLANQILPINISCIQLYLYDYDGPDIQAKKIQIDKLMKRSIKRYCPETKGLQPTYNYTNNMNQQMIEVLKNAESLPFVNGKDVEAPIADGILKFHRIQHNKLDVTIGINDYRLSQYHRNNGVTKLSLDSDSLVLSYLMTTEGMMSLLEKINRAFLQQNNPKEIIFGSYMYMPFDGEDKALVNKTINIIGTGLYPLGLTLLLPLFLYSIVSEKEERLLEVMRMNGLDLKYYWINTFIFNFLLSLVTFIIFYVFGYFIIGLSFFTETSPLLMWILLIGWAIAQISLTNFVQIFISNGKSATIIGYLLSIFSSLVGETIAVFVYSSPMLIPNWLLLFPPISLCRSLYLMGMACSSTGCIHSFQYIDPELIKCIVILYGWFLMFLLSIWLNDKVQQEYGVAKKITFIQTIKNCLFRRNNIQIKQFSQVQIQMRDNKGQLDGSVHKNNNYVNSLGIRQKSLVVKELMKKYATTSGQKDYVALKPFSFNLEENQIFGLLGPNGAGKTTLISVLTGMYPKSQGNAWINGLQVGSTKVNEFIGVCPQFDLLWPTLSVYQHLKFYALLKGIQKQIIQFKINQSLKDVDLLEWKDKPSQQLSGGMQRRLSIAIALVANPCVVFLDQPSSGLDPTHRRRLWDILQNCKNKTSIILTTHLMEEAEALCDRVGIISKGQLRCIGKTQELKSSYGQGYRVYINFINLLSSDNDKIVRQIKQKFNAKVISSLDSRVVLKVEKQKMLDCVGWLKQEKTINWRVSQPTLHDVFLNFID